MSTFYLTPFTKRKENTIDRFFNDLCYSGFNHRFNSLNSNINETDDTITLTIDLPGFEKSDIKIDYIDDQLYIEAKSDQRNEINQQYTIRNIDIKKSNAELKNGVLTLQLEKASAAKKQLLKIN